MKKEKQHKKSETTIGKIIYGFLLFMPLFAIGVTSLISTFNANAKQETKINYKYTSNEVNSNADLIPGNIYKLEINNTIVSNSTYRIYFYEILENSCTYYNTATSTSPVAVSNTPYLYIDSAQTQFFIETSDNISIYVYNIVGEFIVKLKSIDNNTSELANYFSYTDYNEIESVQSTNLDSQEVFYNAVDKVTESPLFSWATNSIIYTTMNATCTQLSITTPFIPLLLSYWLIISVIYFLYDIAIMLIWLLHDKIHELRDSLT